ncbi:hypothetical protein ACWPKO_10455 [Coraliomargarita sp. W4R53]
MRSLYCLCALSCLLLSGCAARYGIEGHRARDSEATLGPTEYPLLTLKVGERIRAVTPAKGMLVGGYWLAIYVENSTVARHLPRDDSYFEGTDIEAVGVGRTKAYYVNSVDLESPDGFSNHQLQGDWFWIEVIEPTH